MSHTIKLWERVIKRRQRGSKELRATKWFDGRKKYTDELFAVRMLLKKHPEEQKKVALCVHALGKDM